MLPGAEATPGALRLRLRCAGRGHFLSQVGDARGWYQLRARSSEGKVILSAHNSAGWFDAAALEGTLALCQAGWDGLQLPLENLLRFYYAWRAVDRGGFLIHAASVVVGGRAYVFFGHSETGKTEVAESGRDRGPVLSDDLTLLTLEPEGYRAHSVPFRGRFRKRLVTERRTFPVAGLFQLVRAERNEVTPLPVAMAAANILSCLPFITDRLAPREPGAVLRVCEATVRALPTFRLEYTSSASLWETVLGDAR